MKKHGTNLGYMYSIKGILLDTSITVFTYRYGRYLPTVHQSKENLNNIYTVGSRMYLWYGTGTDKDTAMRLLLRIQDHLFRIQIQPLRFDKDLVLDPTFLIEIQFPIGMLNFHRKVAEIIIIIL